MIKINWGWGIGIFYSLFVIVMVAAVVKSSIMGVDLVQEEYYDADLAYESFRKSRSNAEELEIPPKIQVHTKAHYISINFHDNWDKVEGVIQLYRPSDGKSDKTFPIKVADGVMQVPTADLPVGRWKVKMTWNGDGTDYFMENTVMI